jgi:hypothetical protein
MNILFSNDVLEGVREILKLLNISSPTLSMKRVKVLEILLITDVQSNTHKILIFCITMYFHATVTFRRPKLCFCRINGVCTKFHYRSLSAETLN